jgi:hypothetical protein
MTPAALDRDSLRTLAHSYYFSCALFAAVRLDLAGALANRARTADSLAAEMKTEPDATARLLQFLASIGILQELKDLRFALSDVGQYLRLDHSDSIAKEILMFSGGETYRAWGEMLQTIKTGKPAFEILNGESLFSYLANHPEPAERFQQAWHEITATVAKEFVQEFDFSTARTVTDIGGGYGIFLGTVLRQLPDINGVLFDFQASVKGAEDTFRNLGVEGRVKVVTGNAEKHLPAMEICTMKSVIHGYNDEQAIRILSNCFAALPPSGKVLMLERVIPKEGGYHWSRLVDMTMMVMTGGRERTEEEYAKLYARSGFCLNCCIELSSGFTVLEGIKS